MEGFDENLDVVSGGVDAVAGGVSEANLGGEGDARGVAMAMALCVLWLELFCFGRTDDLILFAAYHTVPMRVSVPAFLYCTERLTAPYHGHGKTTLP